MTGYFALSASSPSRSTWPIAAALSTSPSSTMTSIVALAAAQETGLPPKVEMLPPFHASAMGAVVMTALIG